MYTNFQKSHRHLSLPVLLSIHWDYFQVHNRGFCWVVIDCSSVSMLEDTAVAFLSSHKWTEDESIWRGDSFFVHPPLVIASLLFHCPLSPLYIMFLPIWIFWYCHSFFFPYLFLLSFCGFIFPSHFNHLLFLSLPSLSHPRIWTRSGLTSFNK